MGGAAVCDATAGGWRLISVGHQLRAAARWVRASLLLPAASALVVAGMVLTGWGIDPGTGTGEAVATNLRAPWDVLCVRGPEGRELLAVTAHHGDKLVFLDAVSLHWVADISTAQYPYELALAPDGDRLYVVSYGGAVGGRLLAVDLATLTPLWRTGTGKGS